MLNEREPVTVAILHKMHALSTIIYNDSLEIVLYDWNILGIYYSFYLGK